MDRSEARALVQRFLDAMPHPVSELGPGRWVIVDELTEDHELFWLFNWHTSRGRHVPLGGNCPFAVAKADGRVYSFGARDRREAFGERLRRGELVPASFEAWAASWAKQAEAEPVAAADRGR